MKHLTYKKWLMINLLLIGVLILTVMFALNIGSEKISFLNVFKDLDSVDAAILFSSRLPRVLLAILVGLALSSTGATYQSLLRNPLADPFILGVSGGAALGSVIGVSLNFPFWLIALSAFLSSFCSMLLIFYVAKRKATLSSHTLLLTGVIFNAFCFAFILFINSMVTMEQAYQIIFLLIGNLDVMNYHSIFIASIFILTGFVLLVIVSQKMNILCLGDEHASFLGLNTYKTRVFIFFASSVMVGAAVCVSGLIGFVGLFIPHIVRLIFGSDHRLLVPASGIVGAIFLVFADTVARTLLINTGYATELPVGVITALIGAPCFIYFLKTKI